MPPAGLRQRCRRDAQTLRRRRQRDTRRKIVVGAAVLTEMERTPRFAAYVRDLIGKAVTRPQDWEAITDLLPSAAAEIATPASNSNTASVITDPRVLVTTGKTTAAFQVTDWEQLAG